jgi:predicted component of type VI protein secretion system
MGLYLKVLRLGEDCVDYDLSATFSATGGSIGRSEENDLTLPDTEGFVSRIHAKIESDGEVFTITDCSSNGTLVLEPIDDDSVDAFNEIYIHADKRILIDGGYIVIGEFEIQVQYNGECYKSSDTTGFIEPPKVDTTLSKKKEPVEKVFKQPVFASTSTTDLEQSTEPFEFESNANVSVMQESFSIAEAKEDINQQQEVPEAFNIDDFFGSDKNVGKNTDETEEDDIFASLQNPFAEEEVKQQPVNVQKEQPEQQIEKVTEIPPEPTSVETKESNVPLDVKESSDFISEVEESVVSEMDDLDEPQINSSPLESAHEDPIRPVALTVPNKQEQTLKKQANSDAFFNGLGFDTANLPDDENALEQILLNAGNMLRVLLIANMSLLKARTDLKRELPTALTVVQKEENNPLKFCQSIDEALPYLLFENSPGFLSGQLAIDESSHDLCTHQMAMMAGIQAALKETINKFDPTVVERACEAGHFNKASKYWEFYESSYKKLSKEAQAEFFGSDFAVAYERQVNALKNKGGGNK